MHASGVLELQVEHVAAGLVELDVESEPAGTRLVEWMHVQVRQIVLADRDEVPGRAEVRLEPLDRPPVAGDVEGERGLRACAKHVVAELDVGTVNVREVPGYRLELTPFGGIKDSGLGYKEGVQEAIKSFTNLKTYSLPWA